MNGPLASPSAVLYLDESATIDAICDEFEAEWQQARQPLLESYLGRMSGPVHSELLRALLRIELEYRCRTAEAPSLEEYWRRFPGYRVLIRNVFDDAHLPGSGIAFGRPLEGLLADLFADKPLPPAALAPADAPERARGTAGEGAASLAQAPTVYLAPPGPGGEGDQGPPENARPAAPLPAIPRHVIFSILHEGGMGVVYTAYQIHLDRLVALKMIKGQWAGDEHARKRFLKEASAVAALEHPNIVKVHDRGEHQGQLWFSMEYVPGGSLRDKLANTLLSPEQAAELLEILARAMDVVHKSDIVHRDLKPANVLLTADGTPKIADFGLARRVDVPSELTQSQEIVGTPSYMAPEQARGSKQIDRRADVYALGAILYQTLTGRPPFRGATALETLDLVLKQEPVRPTRLRRKLPCDLETICLKCLEKAPDKRYQSAAELADRLRLFLDGKPIPDRPASVWERLWKWAKRRPAVATLAIVSLLALCFLALSAWQMWRDGVRVGEVRQRVEASLARTEALVAVGQWPSAQAKLDLAEADLQHAPSLRLDFEQRLRSLGHRIRNGQEARQRELDSQKAKEVSRDRYNVLFKGRFNEALLHASNFVGLELPGNRRKAIDAAWEGLKLFQIYPNKGTEPVLEASHFKPRETEAIAADCYTLLWLLAEMKAEGARLRARADALRARSLPGRRHTVDLLAEGVCHYQAGRFSDALRLFGSVVEKDKNHFWAHYLMALCQLRSGQTDLAAERLAVCEVIRRPDRDFLWVCILRGVAHGQSARARNPWSNPARHSRAAEDYFRRAKQLLDAHPGGANPDARYVLLVNWGTVKTLEKDYPNAVAYLRAAAKLQPDLFHAHRALAQVYQLQGHYPEAIAEYAEAIHRHPDLALLYFERGRLHRGRQQARALPSPARLAGGVSAAAAGPLVALPFLCPKPERPDRTAAPRFAGAVAAAVRGPHVALPLLGLRPGEIERAAALRDLDHALRLWNKPPASLIERRLRADAHFERGWILSSQKRPREALDAFTAAADLCPEKALCHVWRGQMLQRLHDYEGAVKAYGEYLRRGGQRTAALCECLGICHYRLAQQQPNKTLRQQHQSQAFDAFSAALDREPNRTTARVHRGWLRLDQGGYSLARQDFDEAIIQNTDNGAAFVGRAYARAKLGDYRRAVEDADLGVVRSPTSPQLLYCAAWVFAEAAAGAKSPIGSRQAREKARRLLRAAFWDHTPPHERWEFLRRLFAERGALEQIRGCLLEEYRQLARQHGTRGR